MNNESNTEVCDPSLMINLTGNVSSDRNHVQELIQNKKGLQGSHNHLINLISGQYSSSLKRKSSWEG